MKFLGVGATALSFPKIALGADGSKNLDFLKLGNMEDAIGMQIGDVVKIIEGGQNLGEDWDVIIFNYLISVWVEFNFPYGDKGRSSSFSEKINNVVSILLNSKEAGFFVCFMIYFSNNSFDTIFSKKGNYKLNSKGKNLKERLLVSVSGLNRANFEEDLRVVASSVEYTYYVAKMRRFLESIDDEILGNISRSYESFKLEIFKINSNSTNEEHFRNEVSKFLNNSNNIFAILFRRIPFKFIVIEVKDNNLYISIRLREMNSDLFELIEKVSSKTQINSIYSHMIAFVESNYGQNLSNSSAGAVGPMQVMPSTFLEIMGKSHTSATRYELVEAGVRKLKRDIEKMGVGSNGELAVSELVILGIAYNGGFAKINPIVRTGKFELNNETSNYYQMLIIAKHYVTLK